MVILRKARVPRTPDSGPQTVVINSLGKLIKAHFLASRGAGVVIFDLPNSDGAAVASELGGKVLFCPGDVTNPQDAQNAAEMAMKEFGSLQGTKVEQNSVSSIKV